MRAFWTILILAVLATPGRAEVQLDGFFIAQQTCPAFQSFNSQTNPGNISTTPERAYRIVAANKAEATHYWIIVPGVEPERRWVAVGCGIRTTDAAGTTPVTPPTQGQQTSASETQYILAVSWQPAFCEGHADKPECASQTADRYDATHFTLHGLWPQPERNSYCSVSDADKAADKRSEWTALPPVTLGADLCTQLDEVMPGTQSSLERHEWTKHGTCYGTTQDEYFGDALALMSALNGPPVVDLLAGNIGREVTLQQVRAAFDQGFGPGTGERVRMACTRDGNRLLITELTIGLTGTITAAGDFASLVAAASPTDGGCTMGVVDAVGMQ
jgi:ribonuclease T2